jgi:hypothetical protein
MQSVQIKMSQLVRVALIILVRRDGVILLARPQEVNTTVITQYVQITILNVKMMIHAFFVMRHHHHAAKNLKI